MLDSKNALGFNRDNLVASIYALESNVQTLACEEFDFYDYTLLGTQLSALRRNRG